MCSIKMSRDRGRWRIRAGVLLQKQMDSWASSLPQRQFAKHLVSCHNLWKTSSIFLHLSAKSERPRRWQLWMCRVHRVSGREVCISSDSWADSEWLSDDRWHQNSPVHSVCAHFLYSRFLTQHFTEVLQDVKCIQSELCNQNLMVCEMQIKAPWNEIIH